MFELDKQKLLVELLLANPELFARCNGIIKPSYFDPALKKSVAYLQEHFEKYREIPNQQIIKAETGFTGEIHSLSKAEQQYASEEIEKFCQVSAAIEAVYAGPDLIEKGDIETLWQNIKIAASISLNKDLGISYFDNVDLRLKDLLNNPPNISTGWESLDEVFGGTGRQELLLYAGASGVGKSIVMSNHAVNLVRQGYKGIYISLELADRVVAKRFDSMVTAIAQGEILQKIDDVVNKVEQFRAQSGGALFIKRMPESVTTANHIRAYLKEFEQTHSYTPDFIVVDYLDLMATNRGISNENIWLADKYKAEELRAVCADYDCVGITASQLGRASLEAEKVGQQHIQGGYSKIQTADNMIAIVQTDQMRAMGLYLFEFTKTRNSGGVGTAVEMGWDPISLRVTDLKSNNRLELKPKKPVINTILDTGFNSNKKPELETGKKTLLDMMGKR
jgi:KaiC/GvpD/RAD55 family RecA-like ATPase